MTTPSQDTLQALEALRRAVNKALDKKKRLGQYAVVWIDGKVTYIGDNPPSESTQINDNTDQPGD